MKEMHSKQWRSFWKRSFLITKELKTEISVILEMKINILKVHKSGVYVSLTYIEGFRDIEFNGKKKKNRKIYHIIL